MTYEINEIDDDFIRAHFQGTMLLKDHKALQVIAQGLIEQGKKLKILAIIENFEGWEKVDGWNDIGFLINYGDDIIKMAIVVDDRWKDEMLMFTGKGLRTTEIETFSPDLLQDAERWVRQ